MGALLTPVPKCEGPGAPRSLLPTHSPEKRRMNGYWAFILVETEVLLFGGPFGGGEGQEEYAAEA
jgi:hypothetical protein